MIITAYGRPSQVDLVRNDWAVHVARRVVDRGSQLYVLGRRAPKRVAVSNIDRLVFTGLDGLAPEVLDAVKILKPETIIRWHRAGFRAWWRWKSRPRGGRPRTT